ncbi:hypothetical protein [Psychrobacter glacincola]|uniref:hypothetical protein n=1 Tax=Psychrobacter glacincola TaxID=56810 RepID=UPI0039AFA480
MEPIIYSSQDSGAPQLSVGSGILNTVIKGCLVTGYGDKAAAGWEAVYEDMATYKLAIRPKNPKSIKSVLLLNDAPQASTIVTAYTDWSLPTQNGVNQFGSGYFVKEWTADNPRWILLATDSFFYLFVYFQSVAPNFVVMSGFGDVNLLMPGEGSSALIASIEPSVSSDNTGHKSVAVSNGVVAKFPAPLFPQKSTAYGWGDASPTLASGNSYRSEVVILSRFLMYQNKDGTMQPTFELPGMLMPYSEITSGVLGSYGMDILENQHPYVNPILGFIQVYHGKVWIHTDDWG